MPRTSFLDALHTGAHGVTVDLRAGGLRVVAEHPRGCRLEDAEGGARLEVRLSATRMDLGARALLEADLRHEARLQLRAAHAEAPREGSDPTEREGFDPIVELEHLELDGAPALRVLRRQRFRPGDEVILHELFVPLPKGTLTVQIEVAAGMTGLREVLAMERALGGGGASPPGASPPGVSPPRAALDHPAHDTPLDALSRARKALWSFRQRHPMRRTAELPPAPEGELTLEEAGCALVPPPRHLRIELPMAPTLVSFSRAALTGGYRLFEVWRLPDRLDPRRGAERRLVDLARRTTRGWADEGALVLTSSPRRVARFGARPQIEDEVSMVAGERRSRVLQRWFVDADGVVFRVSASGPPELPAASYREEVLGALATWRRLDEVGPAPARKRPWWLGG